MSPCQRPTTTTVRRASLPHGCVLRCQCRRRTIVKKGSIGARSFNGRDAAMAAPPLVRTRRNTILGTDTDTDTERDESLSELLGNRTKKLSLPLVQLSFLHCGIVLTFLLPYNLNVAGARKPLCLLAFSAAAIGFSSLSSFFVFAWQLLIGSGVDSWDAQWKF